MELNAGYQQTDVGIIPSDWEVVELAVLLTAGPKNGYSPASSRTASGTPTLTLGATTSGVLVLNEETIKRLEESIAPGSDLFLQAGDVLIQRSNTPDLVGTTAVFDGPSGVFVYPDLMMRVRFADAPTAHWFWRFANSGQGRSFFRRVASGSSGSMPKISGRALRQMPVPVPSPTERRLVANALGDVDNLIAGIDGLIAKKRDLRLAVMQQLLSGETRLPGHMKPWTEARLGELGTFVKGSGVRKSEANSGALPCVRYGELYTHHDNVVRRFFSSISPRVAATATRLERGDLLFAGSGETKEEIGKCAAFAGDFLAYAGGDIVILRNHRQNPTFMGYYCNSPVVGRQKASKGQGDAVVHISARALADISVRLPSVPEQDAIAEVLEDSDAEISSLEERRAKTQDLKLAMMQELLTGKTRLHTTGGSNG